MKVISKSSPESAVSVYTLEGKNRLFKLNKYRDGDVVFLRTRFGKDDSWWTGHGQECAAFDKAMKAIEDYEKPSYEDVVDALKIATNHVERPITTEDYIDLAYVRKMVNAVA